MRWLCFLLLLSPAAASGQTTAGGPKPLRFDFGALPATRDSFVFRLNGQERGWAVWQYEIRTLEVTQELIYTATSEFEPVEQERLKVVVNRLTGEPISTFHHTDLFSPESDTVMVEHDLEVKGGEISGRRRAQTKSGEMKIVPVHHPFPPGTALGDYVFLAAAATNAAPGDSLAGPAYKESVDSMFTLRFIAEQPTTVQVPAGRFDVLPLLSRGFRIYTTRSPRRVIKGETLKGEMPDGVVFSFELVRSGPVVPTPD